MAGSSFQPPISLSPSQAPIEQISFVNQNFQQIASTLETNSLRIVFSGTASITPTTQSTTWVTIAHNLGYIPVPQVFFYNVNRTIGGNTIVSSGALPLPTWINLSLDTVNGVVKMDSWIDCTADKNNLYIFCFNSANTTPGQIFMRYYLMQQPSSG